MISLLALSILALRLLPSASCLPFGPILPREVTLNQAAVDEAQQRDDTATRAFSSVSIKTSSGQCFSVDPLSGDFRENLTPIQLIPCDPTSPNQKWDVITSGKHDNVPGFALIVSSLTNACLNFDPRRAAGNQVILFSCGGRADGSGSVTDSQLFPFGPAAGTGPFVLTPKNSNNETCLVPNGALLDQTACNALSPSPQELFTIETATSAATTTSSAAALNVATTDAAATTVAVATTTTTTTTTPLATSESSTATKTTATVQSVFGSGGRLNPTAVAEAQQRDNNATRAFTGVSIKSSSGKCLMINPNAGDFRENLIPIEVNACNSVDPGQKWDIITKGNHDNQPGFALIVSSLTNGCLNFDPRRAAGDQVILFSCGGRADGTGKVTDSQLFAFNIPHTGTRVRLPLVPKNGKGELCLVDQSGRLGPGACETTNANGPDVFTIG